MSTGRAAVETASLTTYVPLINLQGTDGTLTGSNATVVAANSGRGVSRPFDTSLLVENS